MTVQTDATSKRAPERGDWRWLAFAVPAVATALFAAVPYVTFHFTRIELDPAAPSHIVFLSLHGLSAGVALLIGPLQFVRRIRARHPRAHRTIGAVYLLAVLMASVLALAAAIISTSGFSAQVGFVLLDAFWLYTGFKALRSAQTRDFAWHRIWMIRNYSATFAAVILRVILTTELSLLPLVGIEVAQSAAYDVAAWGSFTISVLVTELFIVQRSLRATLPGRVAASLPPQDADVAHEQQADQAETTG